MLTFICWQAGLRVFYNSHYCLQYMIQILSSLLSKTSVTVEFIPINTNRQEEYLRLGKYWKMKRSKFCGYRHKGRGGVRAGEKIHKRNFNKCFFQKPYRIILGPPKHVLHLVWSVLGISTAIKTALKVAPTGSSKWSINGKVKHYNWTRKIDFSMGPSVKFVLAIIDSISPKKLRGLIFEYFP